MYKINFNSQIICGLHITAICTTSLYTGMMDIHCNTRITLITFLLLFAGFEINFWAVDTYYGRYILKSGFCYTEFPHQLTCIKWVIHDNIHEHSYCILPVTSPGLDTNGCPIAWGN